MTIFQTALFPSDLGTAEEAMLATCLEMMGGVPGDPDEPGVPDLPAEPGEPMVPDQPPPAPVA